MSRCSTASLATYDGPTGDVNTAFTHLVKRQLLSAPRTSVVRASPIYRAVVCHYSRNDVEGPRHAGSDDTAKSDVSKQFEKGKKAPAATVEEATTAAVAVPAVGVPAAVARRGVVLRDPLLLRKLRKQQSGTPSSPGCTRMAVCSSGQETGHKDAGDDGLGRGEDSVGVHWSKRSLHLMTAVGWDVFRHEMGIRIEVVERRRKGAPGRGDNNSSGRAFSSDLLRPIRCWEEARLPLALGTVVAKRFLLPTPIQSQCVPLALASIGRSAVDDSTVEDAAQRVGSGWIDVLAVAETGSGKTAAYLIPLLATVISPPVPLGPQQDDGVANGGTGRTCRDDWFVSQGPLALVVVPTRELAEQVTREALNFVQGMPQGEMSALLQNERSDPHDSHHNALNTIRVVKIVGGETAEAQYNELVAGAHVVIGTVGQLEALLTQRLLALGTVRMVVMDEADRMLIEQQQQHSLIAVLERCPLPRQTLMFTATLSGVCEGIANKYFSPDGYVVVRVPHSCATIAQVFEVVPSDPNMAAAEGSGEQHAEGDQNSAPMEVGGRKERQRPPVEGRKRSPLVHPVKFARLVNHLSYARPPVVVFANEKRTCDALSDELHAEAARLTELADGFSLEALVGEVPKVLQACSVNQRGVGRVSLHVDNLRSLAVVHSDQSQAERRRLVDAFRNGERRVLITTDLLARGLDVPNVTLVINYDMPLVIQSGPGGGPGEGEEGAVQKYIHRIGRTGRAGADGVAVSFVALPTALVQRAQQHLMRSGAAGAGSAPGRMSLVADTWSSEKSRAHKRDRSELIGSEADASSGELCVSLQGNGGGNDEDNDMADDDYDERDSDTNDVSQRTNQQHSAGKRCVNTGNNFFAHDELVLQPLWEFLVSCAEANRSGPMSGADIICQQRCQQVQVPPVLAAIMQAYTQRSPHGTITM